MDGNVIGRSLIYDNKVVVLSEIDSTNEEVKRRVAAGENEGLVVISEKQTAGKGRRGRGFFSPEGSGIYMSILFCPSKDLASDVVLITTQAAVAVAHAVSEVCGKETKIKWVNDIYLDDKKICGILAELISDPETGEIKNVVVGIGINVKKPKEIPDEIKDIFGYIYDTDEEMKATREELAAAVINELNKYYKALPDRSFLKEYKDRSNVIGKEIVFGTPGDVAGVPGDDWERGRAVDIDDEGGLIVELEDGSKKVLNTGEISLRVEEV